MSNLNQCNFIGRLGKDPETSFMPSGGAVSKISIAISEKWKDKNTGQAQERTEWVRVSAFGKLAEIMAQYLKKGSLVYISGSMKTSKYTDNAGVEKYSTEIVAREMKMLDSRSESAEQPNQDQAAQAKNNGYEAIPNQVDRPQGQSQGFDDSEIPF